MIWSIYGQGIFPCIRRIQKGTPVRGFYSIFLRIDYQKYVQCKQPSKKDLIFKKKVSKNVFFGYFAMAIAGENDPKISHILLNLV